MKCIICNILTAGLLGILISTSACSPPPRVFAAETADGIMAPTVVLPYVTEFMTITVPVAKINKIFNVGTIYMTEDLSNGGKALGECYMGNPWSINLRKSWWDAANDMDRRGVVYHELTHCVYNLEHSTDPTSYMYKYQVHFYDVQKLQNQVINLVGG